MGAEPKEEAKGELTISILKNPFTVLRRLYLSSCTIRDMKGHAGSNRNVRLRSRNGLLKEIPRLIGLWWKEEKTKIERNNHLI
jgi:hypothetical protein